MEKLQADENFIESQDKTSFWDFKSKYDFVDSWFLMGSPYPLLVLTSAYLLFVLKLGPSYLKNRRPFDLKNALLVYNIIQVGLSAWLVSLCFDLMWRIGPIQLTCTIGKYTSKLELATMIYYYFACKITELIDTIFFVLRKKQSQVTFLHVYHHTMMVWNGWYFLKYEPGTWMLFLGTINCLVHVIMYAYYGLSAYPSLHKYLWWKKYITSLQLIQFGLILIHMVFINLFVDECKPSKTTVIYLYSNVMLFIYLFSRFYRNAYSKSNSNKIENGTNNNKNELNKNQISGNNGAKYRSVNSKKNGNQFANGLKTHS